MPKTVSDIFDLSSLSTHVTSVSVNIPGITEEAPLARCKEMMWREGFLIVNIIIGFGKRPIIQYFFDSAHKCGK